MRLNRKRRSRATRETLAPLQSTFYVRVAFLAPESQAPLARNELKTFVTVKLLKLPWIISKFVSDNVSDCNYCKLRAFITF